MPREKITQIKKELQRTKEDLEDLEMYIREFTSFLPLAVCTLNPLKIILDVNQAFQKLTQFNTVEIVGNYLENIFLEKKQIDNLFKKVQEKEKIETKELTLVSKEKKEIPVSLSVSVRKDIEGNFIGYFVSVTDITEVKKSREELEKKIKDRTKELEDSREALMNMLEDVEETRKRIEEERDKTETVITNFTDGLLVLDRENRVTLINPEAERLLKIEGKEIKNKILNTLIEQPALKKIAELIKKEEGGEFFRRELLFRKPADRVLEVTNVSLVPREEKVIILHDISREKLIERMKTEFVSLAAHQLRTPLSAIKWTLKMLLDGDLGEITKEQREFIEKTYRSNERMISLINDLLNVTRIEEGRYIYNPSFVQIENIVQFVINSFKDQIARRKIKLEYKKPKEKLPKVKVDAEKIRLAINNLVDNAIRYTLPDGKVTVSLKYAKKEIEIQIKDTGVGIPEIQKERVFTRFFRGTNVVRMETEGTGLGLFIAKNIVEAHDGRIWFESKENKGTTFHIALPVKKEFEEFLKEF